jgi:hypothetical protein
VDLLTALVAQKFKEPENKVATFEPPKITGGPVATATTTTTSEALPARTRETGTGTSLLARQTLLEGERRRAAGTREIETQTPLLRSSILSSGINRVESRMAMQQMTSALTEALAKRRVPLESVSEPGSVAASGTATPFPEIVRSINPGGMRTTPGMSRVVSALQTQTDQEAGSTSNVDFL